MADDEFGDNPLSPPKPLQYIKPTNQPSTTTIPANDPTADLYADLATTDGHTLLTATVTSQKTQIEELQSQLDNFRQLSTDLQQQLNQSVDENSTLKTNISRLYDTAKLELKRKDSAIDQLEQEVMGLKQRRSSGTVGAGGGRGRERDGGSYYRTREQQQQQQHADFQDKWRQRSSDDT